MPTKTRVINRNIDDPIAMENVRSQLRQLDGTLRNFQTLRSRFDTSDNPDPRRDYNAEFGYPETEGITLRDYWTMYHRPKIQSFTS